MNDAPQRPFNPSRLILGLAFISAGLLWVLDNYGYIDARPFWHFWPLVLIAIGLTKLFTSGGRRGGGVALLLIGSFFALREWGVHIELREVAPFALLFFGLMMVGRALSRRQPRPVAGDPSSFTDATAILGSSKQVSSSPQFRGGSLTAILGAAELDLRQATVDPSGPAVIDAVAFWGGVEIFVPEHWVIDLRGVPILGGFEDTTLRPAGESQPHLVVRGFALMGGVEVKNRPSGRR